MSYYLFFHGTLGSGKSTCAKQLAKLLDAKRIDLDAVLSENKLDHQASNSACIAASNFIKGLNLVIPEARDLLEHGKIIIFDGCLYHREVLDYLLNTLVFPNYVFTFKASLEVCIQRDANREKTIGKRVAEEVYKLVSDNNFGILIDNNSKTVEEVIEEVRSYLPKSE